jgi:hypothetical protein
VPLSVDATGEDGRDHEEDEDAGHQAVDGDLEPILRISFSRKLREKKSDKCLPRLRDFACY